MWTQDTSKPERILHTLQVNYPGLVDKKGRVPGHEYKIFRWTETMDKYTCYSHATRAGETFGGAASSYKEFDTVEEAKAYMESTMAKLEKATRSNKKQFVEV